ncbi:rod shape-determining protein MreC [Paenibacillus psychroresistens]|uniref:Cell shape-determining protein MreC n=1 Tax=Paenibacillus psychroresistens TaxID=1778678 RepID=A0A6B8RIJ8_9BACL|nr:rod shape-determining protein MreC [Paenibacillus psychroresistens]QGQ95392.1 rod shape-determining protein MreC [Paenibacillus psychroresistens]
MGNKKLLMLLFFLIVFIALMGLTIQSREKLTWPEMFVKDTVSWTQGLFIKPARYVRGWVEDIRSIRLTYEESKVLKSRLSQSAIDTMKLNQLEIQNKDLKKMLNFTERQKLADKYIYHVAEIVAISPDPYSNIININLGSNDGIKVNMAVVSSEGLIGRVTRVDNFYSTVQRLIDIDDESISITPNTKAISATVKGNEASFGIIEKAEINEDNPEMKRLVMTKIDTSDLLKVGDTIITSGMGQIFPKGIVIGKVISKEPDDFGINYKALIEPAADFNHLRYVMVVEVPDVR